MSKNYKPEWAQEKLDPIPKASPVAFKPPEPLHKRISRMIRAHQVLAEMQGMESEEEELDFDEEDDHEVITPYTLTKDPVSGREMPAGDLEVLEEERRKAHPEAVRKAHAILAEKKQKKAALPPKNEPPKGGSET